MDLHFEIWPYRDVLRSGRWYDLFDLGRGVEGSVQLKALAARRVMERIRAEKVMEECEAGCRVGVVDLVVAVDDGI